MDTELVDACIVPGAGVLAEAHGLGIYRRGTVIAVAADEILVAFEGQGEEQCDRSMVWPANEAGLYLEDVMSLHHLSEAAIVENMRIGLEYADAIYQWVGPILVALNPMRPLPDLYSNDYMQSCRDAASSSGLVMPAHPFSQAELAIQDILRHQRSAAFVVSGESGAGKTETSRHLLAYCLWRCDRHGNLPRVLTHLGPVVELFGSAGTIHNANSSRVGRFLQLYLTAGTDGSAVICHANLQTFLLERSRVVAVGPGERGFHIFYALLASSYTEELGLSEHGRDGSAFGYLRSGLLQLEARDDAADMAIFVKAFEELGVDATHTRAVLQILASVLVLGNVTFQAEEGHEDASRACPVPGAERALSQLSSWLGVDLRNAMLERQLRSGGFGVAPVVVALDVSAAALARDAIARAIYVRLVAHVVELVNNALTPEGRTDGHADKACGTFGLLDVFGFERFNSNSLEQLLINFCNERLHQHFLQRVFAAEVDLYAAEGVQWPDIAVPDNSELIALCEASPLGLFSLLDDLCSLPTPSDEAFCTVATQTHMRSRVFSRPKHHRRRKGKGSDDARGDEFVLHQDRKSVV